MPARARSVRARATRLRARRPHPRRAARALARVLLYSVTWTSSLRASSGRTGSAGSRRTRADHGRYADSDGTGRRRRRTRSASASARSSRSQELAQSYDGADDWARALLDEANPEAPPVSEAGHGRRRRVPSLRPRRDGLPAVKRVVLLVVAGRCRVRRRGRGRRGAPRQPEAGRYADARPHAAAAAARPGRAPNGHRYRSKPINLFRKRKLWLRLAGERSQRDEP